MCYKTGAAEQSIFECGIQSYVIWRNEKSQKDRKHTRNRGVSPARINKAIIHAVLQYQNRVNAVNFDVHKLTGYYCNVPLATAKNYVFFIVPINMFTNAEKWRRSVQ